MDIKEELKNRHWLFELYCKFEMEDTLKIFKRFPYLLAMDYRKLTLFCGQFKKYRLTKEQIIKYCTWNTGLLGTPVTTFKGIFDSMLVFNISARETK